MLELLFHFVPKIKANLDVVWCLRALFNHSVIKLDFFKICMMIIF